MSDPGNTEMTAEQECEAWRQWFRESTGGAWDNVDDVEAEIGRGDSDD